MEKQKDLLKAILSYEVNCLCKYNYMVGYSIVSKEKLALALLAIRKQYNRYLETLKEYLEAEF